MNYSAMGQCNLPNAAFAPRPFAAYSPQAYPMVPVQYDIIGQTAAAPAPAPGAEVPLTQKVSNFLNQETVGVKNGYLLAGAATLGLVWYGYRHRWFR